MSTQYSLTQLGWSALFAQQLTLEDLNTAYPARIVSIHRSHVDAVGERGIVRVVIASNLFTADTPMPVAVGDWVLIEIAAPRVHRILERRSLIARMAAGTHERRQLIAANVDTLLVVTSCNEDFNASRLERYLVLAREADVEPIVILTKADLCDDAERFLSTAQALAAGAYVAAVNATSRSTLETLAPWLAPGQTLALIGSSGVGKSTLINMLLGACVQSTQAIREDDSRGRHTTTSRQMFSVPGGAWVIDTPGMRELKVGVADDGLQSTYTDIAQLAGQCRFRDCDHRTASGCAVLAAVDDGSLDPRRLENYWKLQRESAHASRSLHERRELERRWGRIHRNAQRERRKDRGR